MVKSLMDNPLDFVFLFTIHFWFAIHSFCYLFIHLFCILLICFIYQTVILRNHEFQQFQIKYTTRHKTSLLFQFLNCSITIVWMGYFNDGENISRLACRNLRKKRQERFRFPKEDALVAIPQCLFKHCIFIYIALPMLRYSGFLIHLLLLLFFFLLLRFTREPALI